MGAIAVATGAFFLYQALIKGEMGFAFGSDGKKKITGNENAVVLFAKRDPVTNLDVPVIIKFIELKHIPRGARLHYFRNYKKHYYELRNDINKKKLVNVVLKDKKAYTPEIFQIAATMQPYKDAIEYSPPTLLQKLAPGMILLGMGLVGLLMVVTSPPPGG